MLSLRTKLSNVNRLYGPKSSQSDSHLIFDLTHLLAVGESLLCGHPIVDDYILEINLTKRKKDLRMVLFTFNDSI